MTRKKYQFTIQYDGSDFHGWQVQKNGRTVQGDIENALNIIFPKEKISLIGSGRTDTGVHAIGQVAHVELPSRLSPLQLCNALQGNLNTDIQIDSAIEVDEDFHARFSATAREYEYHLVKRQSPFSRKYAAELKWDIDPKLLYECASLLKGEHDFTSFCKANAEVENKICIIYKADWIDNDDRYIFTIQANRFLHHMVRYLIGTMLEVARGRYTIQDFIDILNREKAEIAVSRAPAKGLFLKKVYYD